MTEIKQATIGEILDSEKQMVLDGATKYGDWFINADQFNALFQNFLVSVKQEQFIFSCFLSMARKHAQLALFSAVRLHHIQMMLNVRIVLEAGATAAFAIAHPVKLDSFVTQKDGIWNTPQRLTQIQNQWLDENYKSGSDAIKRMKTEIINKSAAHANLIYAMKNFTVDDGTRKFLTPFFDFEERHHVETNLWMIGNVLMGLMDLFYGVNQKSGGLVFKDDFIFRLKKLEDQNKSLKKQAMSSEWFKDAKSRADN